MEAQRVLPRGQCRGVHAAPHASSGHEQAEAHLHPKVFRVRRRDSSNGGELLSVTQTHTHIQDDEMHEVVFAVLSYEMLALRCAVIRNYGGVCLF